MKFNGIFSGIGYRTNTSISPPQISGAVSIGGTLTIFTGTYNKPTEKIYTLLRDGISIKNLEKVPLSTIQSYQLAAVDIGPTISLLELALAGGAPVQSNTLSYDHTSLIGWTGGFTSLSGAGLILSGTNNVAGFPSNFGAVSTQLTQSIFANMPTLSIGGGANGKDLIIFDGVNDFLSGVYTKGSAHNDYELIIWGQRVSPGTTADGWLTYIQGGTARYYLNDSNTITLRMTVQGGANVSSATDPDGVNAMWSGEASGSTINFRKNGTVENTSAGTVSSRTDGGDLILGAVLSGACSNISIQGWAVGPALTTQQRAEVVAYGFYKTGIGN